MKALFDFSYQLREDVIAFAKSNSYLVLPLSDKSRDYLKENFIQDETSKYFILPEKRNELYLLILKSNQHKRRRELVEKEGYTLEFSNLKNSLINNALARRIMLNNIKIFSILLFTRILFLM